MATADEKRHKLQLKADARKLKAEALAQANMEKVFNDVIEHMQHVSMVKDSTALLQTLFTEDDFRSVVLGHAWLENALVLLIERHLHNRRRFNVATMGYRQKLSLAQGLAELRDDELQLMTELGNIRNKFAHRLNAKLVPEDADMVRNAAEKQPSLKSQIDHVAKLFMSPPNGGRKIQYNKVQGVIRAAIYLMQIVLNARLEKAKPVLPADVKWVQDNPPQNLLAAIMALPRTTDDDNAKPVVGIDGERLEVME